MTALAVAVRPSGQDTDDLDLVSGVRAGDDRAFELLYARYQPRIAIYVRGMVQDDGRAEDVTQEVFISALRRMRETTCEIAFKPWIYEIAKNACIDAFRRSRHTNEVSFDAHDALGADEHGRLADVRATPDNAFDTKLDLDNLRGAFGGLSETHHQILVMRELEGLSYRDIGARLGMSRAAVESTLFRARRRLGEEYDELVSGKRCIRVRSIIDAGGRAPGVRDQRRLDRHISHCQPCRRHALMAGIDLEARPARPPIAARIAGLLPLPGLWRRSGAQDAPAQVLGSPGHAAVAHWSANVASTVDPATLGGWGKALFAAASVAAAGVGAGAAITERDALRDFFSRAPAIAGIEGSSGASDRDSGARRQDSSARKPRSTAPERGGVATRRSGRPSAVGGADGSGAPRDARKPAPGREAAGKAPKPQPADSRGSEGPSGGTAAGGLPEQTLDDRTGAGDATSTVNDLKGQVGGTVSGATGQADDTLSEATGPAGAAATGAAPAQGIAAPVTTAVDAALGGV